MKTTLTMFAMLTLLAVANIGYAQDAADQRVKILPSSLPGIIKLHYALPVNEPLQITFFNEKGDVLWKDKIHGIAAAPFGISKKYDVSKINTGDFWMEISSRKHVFVYHVTPSDDRKRFTAVLEPTSSQLLVKANN